MPNLMTQVYIGYIVEIIRDSQGNPTMDMKVRVPSVHGASPAVGMPNVDLPIAKPLIIPGMMYNRENIEDIVSKINKVYIIFEGGNHSKPVYFGIKNESSIYKLQTNNSFILYYDSIASFPETGNIAYLYRALDTNILYYYDTLTSSYKRLYDLPSAFGDLLIGTVKLFTDSGPTEGLRVIDGVQTEIGDKVLVVDAPTIQDGIYTVSNNGWSLLTAIEDRNVVSVDTGATFGGTMLKYTNGTTVIVKKSELTKWKYIS